VLVRLWLCLALLACGAKGPSVAGPSKTVKLWVERAEKAEENRDHEVARKHYEKAIANAKDPVSIGYARREFAAAIEPTEFLPGKVFGTGTMKPIDYCVALAEGRREAHVGEGQAVAVGHARRDARRGRAATRARADASGWRWPRAPSPCAAPPLRDRPAQPGVAAARGARALWVPAGCGSRWST